MPAYIKTLKEGTDIVYPQTKALAVYDEDGITVEARLEGLQDNIDDINPLLDEIRGDVADNAADITTNAGNIAANATAISGLQSDVEDIQEDISNLEDDVEQNTRDIVEIKADLDNLKEKVRKMIISYTITLSVSGWQDNSYVVEIPEITTSSSIVVSPNYTTMLDYRETMTYCSEQNEGSLVFTCVKTPLEDLVIDLLIFNRYQSEN